MLMIELIILKIVINAQIKQKKIWKIFSDFIFKKKKLIIIYYKLLKDLNLRNLQI